MGRLLPQSLRRSLPRFFFNDTATTAIYTLSLHDALPIYSETSWVLAGGTEGSFLCSLSSRFSGRGGGGGGLPTSWRRSGVPRRCRGAKENVRLHRFFLHQISLESKLNGRQKVKGGHGSLIASISTSLIASLFF